MNLIKFLIEDFKKDFKTVVKIFKGEVDFAYHIKKWQQSYDYSFTGGGGGSFRDSGILSGYTKNRG